MYCPRGHHSKVYSPYGAKLPDADGFAIEQGRGPAAVDTFRPGSVMPNHTLKAPDNLRIMGASATVDGPTRLQDLLKPNVGVCHWAACTEVR
jgi:hypothetical protein